MSLARCYCLDGIHGPGTFLASWSGRLFVSESFLIVPVVLIAFSLWQTESVARDWLAIRTWPSTLYEVEVIEHRASFLADINRLQFSSEDGPVSGMMDQARTYWAGTAGSNSTEVLLEGRVRVVKWLSDR